ncbi:MAG: putative metal-binding motif-containing protein, partial [Myxococcota bacterium]
MRVLTMALVLAGCSFVGFDDLEVTPCIQGADRSVEAFARANALCAELAADQPPGEGLAWVCREQIDDDLFCTIGRPDADNDGVGAGDGTAEGGLDCDDSDPDVFGGREEMSCDGQDNDCDGRIDEGLISQPLPSAPLDVEVGGVRVGRSGTRGVAIGRDGTLANSVRWVSLQPPLSRAETSDSASPSAAAPADGGAFLLYRPSGSDCDFAMCRNDDCGIEDRCAASDASVGTDVFGPSMVVSGTFVYAAWLDTAEDANAACASGATSEVTVAMGRTNVTSAGRPRAIVSLGMATPVARPVLLPSRSV